MKLLRVVSLTTLLVQKREVRQRRERLLIVGHADRNESNPHHIGLKRASAAAIYAVDYRDLPRARIRVASAGAARPLDEGQGSAARARNRRLELTIFALPVPA